MERIEIPNFYEPGMDPGLYISRKVSIDGDILTTFELQLIHKDSEPPLSSGAIHYIDCMFRTYLKNQSNEIAGKMVYFGSKENGSGFDLIFMGDYKIADVVGLLRDSADYMLNFEWDFSSEGKSDDVAGAKFFIKKYKIDVLDDPNYQ